MADTEAQYEIHDMAGSLTPPSAEARRRGDRPSARSVTTERDSVSGRDTTIEYELRRSRRRKKTMQITVDGNGVRVSVPWRASNDRVREFVLSRADWIRERLAVASSEARAAGRRLDGGDMLPYLGRDIRIVVKTVREPAPSARLHGGTLVVCVDEAPSGGERPDPIRDAVLHWYRGRAEEILPARVDRWLPRAVYYRPAKHPYKELLRRGWGAFLPHAVDEYLPRLGHASKPRVLIRDQKTLWGSCAHDGTIRLNWRAVMLEPALIDYIVVHELAHIDVRNHSDDFWELARAILPDVHGLRQRLREVERTLPWWTADRP